MERILYRTFENRSDQQGRLVWFEIGKVSGESSALADPGEDLAVCATFLVRALLCNFSSRSDSMDQALIV